MVTPRGQEWLRGLRDTDTDPNSLHTYFVSRRATCLQPCVHIREPIPCEMVPLPIITESQDYQWRETVGGLQPCCFLYTAALFNYQMRKGTTWWRSRANCVFPLNAPFSSSLPFQSHTSQITFSHFHIDEPAGLRHLCVIQVQTHLKDSCFLNKSGQAAFHRTAGLLWHRRDFKAMLKWIIPHHREHMSAESWE